MGARGRRPTTRTTRTRRFVIPPGATLIPMADTAITATAATTATATTTPTTMPTTLTTATPRRTTTTTTRFTAPGSIPIPLISSRTTAASTDGSAAVALAVASWDEV